ncbi:TetR/AcrR family transcriptional regulator [uncultured Methylobacterium sp.]|uniref:TetR/AcrR family transcriptional regulator n=1 Tax=uncultured Methylobacterium sp. TaxID=157278 RepID=UPI0035CBB3E2
MKTVKKRAAGPRGEVDRAGFVALVCEAAETIVRRDGVRALGMRPLAAAIGYAPNSIYNAVGDLDAVLLRVNARTFDRLHAALGAALDPEVPPRAKALALTDAYLAFVAADPAVWSLVFEHAPAPGTPVPVWHREALARATDVVDATLAPLLPDAAERACAVAALWAALHGLASLSTSGKLGALTATPPADLARMLVARFLAGGPGG